MYKYIKRPLYIAVVTIVPVLISYFLYKETVPFFNIMIMIYLVGFEYDILYKNKEL